MTVQCLTCQNFNLRDAGRMAREGFGLCAKRRPHEFMSAVYQRDCRKHVPAADEVVAKRREWREAGR